MTERSILIKGGRIVSESGILEGDLLIEGEQIKAQGTKGAFDNIKVDETVDASGKYVLPGLIDPHVHFNSPFMGTVSLHDYSNGTIAAAYGGTTTLIDFSTQPKRGSIVENLRQKEKEAQVSYIDWSMHGILLDASPETLREIPELVREGVPSYKCFTTYKHSDRLMDDASILKILEIPAEAGGILMVHCEDDSILEYHLQKELAQGHFEPIYHARSRPASAENISIQRVIDLMKEVAAKVYIVHTSTAESVGMIQSARIEGLPIHSETCTHYLTLTEEKLKEKDGYLYICSPALRTKKDNEALWKGLAAGCIETIGSDDAGVPTEDRIRISEGRFDKVPSGMPGVEPRLAILYSEGVCKGKIDMPKLVSITSTAIARIFGLYPQKGHLAPGADADVTIYDPKPEWVMSAKNHHMNTDFSPFEGFKIKGKVETVLCRGSFVIKKGELVGKSGFGKRVIRHLKK
ncbi:MAG: dihydropyrimidinase [Anaerolineaceae bacterium]|nr:dihydropyrimidinase [Anaerolineaceae bacterium]